MISCDFKQSTESEFSDLFELENICDQDIFRVQADLEYAIETQDFPAVLEIIKIFRQHLEELKSISMLPDCFIFNLISLLYNPEIDLQKECLNLIQSLIVKNNKIGLFLIDNDFIGSISQIIDTDQEKIITFFPLIRSLLFLGIFPFDIPMPLIEQCINCQELQIEYSIFLDNLSSFKQEKPMQHFIFFSIRKMFDLNYQKSYQYLADALFNLSTDQNFAFDVFQQNNLNEFVLFLLQNKEFHCVMLICMFLTNLVEMGILDIFSEEVMRELMKYAVSFHPSKRCQSVIHLFVQLLESEFVQSDLFDISTINKNFLAKFSQKKDSLPFQVKRELSIFVIKSLVKITWDSETMLMFVAFGLFDLINYALFLSDDDLVAQCQQIIMNYLQHFNGSMWEVYIINNIKELIEFDDLLYIDDESEVMQQFLSTISSIFEEKIE